MWRAIIVRLHSLQEIDRPVAPLGRKTFMAAGNSKITSLVLLPRPLHCQD